MTPQRWDFFLDAKTFLDFRNPWKFFFTRKEAEWYRRDREKAGRRCAKKWTRAIKREKEQREGKITQKKEGMRHLLREANFVRILRDFWGGGVREIRLRKCELFAFKMNTRLALKWYLNRIIILTVGWRILGWWTDSDVRFWGQSLGTPPAEIKI